MLTLEEKESSYASPRRRYYIIAGIVLGLLGFAAIGIVVGYFIGRNQSAKSCDADGGKPGRKPQSQKELDEIYKNAVEMVSTENLRANLE